MESWAVPRFHFEMCWAKFDGFLEAVAAAWGQPNPLLDACKCLDCRLRATAWALCSWRTSKLGAFSFSSQRLVSST